MREARTSDHVTIHRHALRAGAAIVAGVAAAIAALVRAVVGTKTLREEEAAAGLLDVVRPELGRLLEGVEQVHARGVVVQRLRL